MVAQNTSSLICFFTETKARKEDITCVHDAFRHLDPEKLLSVLLENQLSWKLDPRLLSGRAKDHLLQRTAAMLKLMYQIEPVPLEKPDQIIIPLQTFRYPGSGNAIKREIRAAILDLSDHPGSDGRSFEYARTISQWLTLLALQDQEQPSCIHRIDALINVPWASVLGSAIWLPSSLTEYERYAELGHLFWIMAYHSFAEAVFEMKASVLEPSPDLEAAAEKMNRFYEEQELKMARISELLSFNAFQDALVCAKPLKEAA